MTIHMDQSLDEGLKLLEKTEDARKKLAHIINPPNNMHIWREGMTSQDVVNTARELGLQVVALCGFVFIPTQSVEDLEACQICFDVAGMLMRNEGE